jgi:hypothetical protein
MQMATRLTVDVWRPAPHLSIVILRLPALLTAAAAMNVRQHIQAILRPLQAAQPA